ncbi:hypothetical protein A499_20363 [Niallia nealsonii AAU1]|nr:hypothetical protein A499_20363 [Niallia nealsonii AAU1]
MEEEQLKVFDEKRVQIGIATRSEVHEKDYGMKPFIVGLYLNRMDNCTSIYKLEVL